MSSDPSGGPVLLLVLSVFIVGWLTAAKEGVRSLRRDARLRRELEEAQPPLRNLASLTEHAVPIILALQICLVLIGLGAAMAGTVWFTAPLAARLGAAGDSGARVRAVLVLIVLFTLIDVLFGIMLPRRIASRWPERVLRFTSGIARAIGIVLYPLVWLLTAVCNGFLHMFGIDPKAAEDEVTEEEIRMMVDIGGESGAIEENEKEMIENIFEFNNRSAEDVMTHRTDVTSLWIGDDHDSIIRTILDTGFSRFPVYDEDIDDIIGILNTRDYLLEMHSEHPREVRQLLREAYFVPETVQADVLFRDMQKRKVQMSIVVDEYGGMSGILTMEDLLEEIVGNLYDEFDTQSEAEIVRLGENKWRISGSASLEDVADALQVKLPLDEEYDTLGGLIFDQFTTLPEDGSQPCVDVDGLHIQVEQLDEHRVESAIVTRIREDAADAEGEPVGEDRKRDK